MATFKTPKWDNSAISDIKYKHLFKKKQKEEQFAPVPDLASNKRKKNRRKKDKLVPNPHFSNDNIRKPVQPPGARGDTMIIKRKSPQKRLKLKAKKGPLNPGGANLDNPENPRGKMIEYHSQLKSKRAIMKMSLRDRMLERLKSSRFRYLNEELYTSEGKSAKELFKHDPEAFAAYHEGYKQQVNKWPMNPLDVIIKSIKKLPVDKIIVDMGCGEAKLAQSVQQKVHSYDLQAANDYVTECEMSNVPLEKNSVDVVVFCLSLMGTNIKDFIFEASRILKISGVLKIAEVQSRFDDVNIFIRDIERFGFKQSWKDLSKDLFYFMDFKKTSECVIKNRLPGVSLLPCLYKKR